MDNRPFPSSLKPQSVLKWEEVRRLRCENRFLILSKKPLIFTSKVWTVLHFWNSEMACYMIISHAYSPVFMLLTVLYMWLLWFWTELLWLPWLQYLYELLSIVLPLVFGYTAVSRKVVGKSARNNPERYCGWFWVHCSWQKLREYSERPSTYVCEC